MKVLFLISLVASLSFGCSDNGAQALKKEIEKKEQELTQKSNTLKPGETFSEVDRNELVDLLVSFYEKYPDNAYSPACLDKLHMIYSSNGDYLKSITYGEIIIEEYKTYVNRAMILESLASTYDIFIEPRDISKVRYYYELLLNENDDLSADKIEGINFRLKNLDKSIEEIILLRQ